VGEIVQANCRKVGVEVKIAATPWESMLQRLRKKEFDATILGWALSWKMDPFQIWHGSQAEVLDSSNSIGYQSPKVDELIEKLRVTFDTNEQQKIYHAIHQQIYEDQPYTFLFVDKQTGAKHARLENLNFYKIRPCVDAREWSASTPRVLGR
jgi:ABC-type transport system substrate-binding protein